MIKVVTGYVDISGCDALWEAVETATEMANSFLPDHVRRKDIRDISTVKHKDEVVVAIYYWDDDDESDNYWDEDDDDEDEEEEEEDDDDDDDDDDYDYPENENAGDFGPEYGYSEDYYYREGTRESIPADEVIDYGYGLYTVDGVPVEHKTRYFIH